MVHSLVISTKYNLDFVQDTNSQNIPLLSIKSLLESSPYLDFVQDVVLNHYIIVFVNLLTNPRILVMLVILVMITSHIPVEAEY